MIEKRVLLWSLAFLFSNQLIGQEESEGAPSIQLLRAEESYLFTKDSEPNQLFLQPLKFIELNGAKGIYLTLGGEYRARFESFTNQNYTSSNESYYSQRLDFHASLRLGSRIRLFGELYHGYTTGEERLLEDDQLDLHPLLQQVAEANPADHQAGRRWGD